MAATSSSSSLYNVVKDRVCGIAIAMHPKARKNIINLALYLVMIFAFTKNTNKNLSIAMVRRIPADIGIEKKFINLSALHRSSEP